MGCSFDCPLRGVMQEVPYSGNKKAEIVFVGESPGKTEERLKRPFMGAAGELLRDSLLQASINPDDVYFLNSTRCRLDKETLSVKEINKLLANCRPHLERAISKLKPKALVLLGDIALRQVGKLKGISKVRGNLIWNDEFNCHVYPTYHPAACLYNRTLLPIFKEDLARLRVLADRQYDTNVDEFKVIEVESIEDVLSSDIKAIALDTETQGLDWSSPNSILISYSIAINESTAYQIYIHERTEDPSIGKQVYWQDKKVINTEYYIKSSNFDTKLDELRRLFESNIKKYMMNGNYDIHHIRSLFKRSGLALPTLNNYAMDIQAGAQLLDENIFARASLEQLRKSFTDITSDYSNEFEHEFNKSNMLAVPKDKLTYYAGMDAIVTYRAAMTIREGLLKNKRLARYLSKLVMPAISRVLFTMEENGVMLDLEALPRAKEHIARMTDELHAEALLLIPSKILELHEGKDITLRRNALIRDVLFHPDGFALVPPKVTKKNNISVDNETRIKLDNKKIPKKARTFLDAYNKWAKYNKLHTTYIPNLTKYVKDDQRIHPNLSVVKVVTGRSSSNAPNMQNIPKRGELAPHIRRLLVAPKGHTLMAFDASQAELRLCAAHSKDTKMLEVYKTGGDIHATTALSILGRKRSEVSDEEFKNARRSAKITNFSFIYGGSTYGFRRQSKVEYGIDFSEQQAHDYMCAFFNTFPGVARYHDEVKSYCRKHGYVQSMLGRKRRLLDARSNDSTLRGRAERQALNHAIQSLSSDLILFSCNVLLNNNLLDENEIRMLLFIHDEVVFEVKDTPEIKAKYYWIVKDAMENPPLKEVFNIELGVPLVAECKIGYNLYDMEEYIP